MSDIADQADKPEKPEKTDEPEPAGPVVARAGQYYRNMRYLMFVLFVGFGAWFAYDGWVGWPKMNEQIRALSRQRDALPVGDPGIKPLNDQLAKLNNGKEKTGWDIGLQKFLAIALPALGMFVLGRALYRSRGEVRLDGQTLYAPGHPPVPFDNITEIDRRLWKKKGIAWVGYDLGEGKQGRILLDDFIYDQDPIDTIYKRVEKFVDPQKDEDEEEKQPDSVESSSEKGAES
jgi:hypothetical protein